MGGLEAITKSALAEIPAAGAELGQFYYLDWHPVLLQAERCSRPALIKLLVKPGRGVITSDSGCAGTATEY
jgi:hypothetical protein